jgi:3-hydroxypropionate dehydrogenase (NADP+)
LFSKLACVGAGTIGSSWAVQFAWNDCDVILYDLTPEILNNAVENVKRILSVLVDNNVIPKAQATEVAARIHPTTNLADLSDAEYVQESVVERLNVKVQVFQQIEKTVAEETIIASSTSGLLMSEIQKPLSHPQRAIIVHPFNPPHLIPLVEIVPGTVTSPDTAKKTQEFMKDVHKEPILVKKEIEGFVADRIQVVLDRELLNLINDGVVDMEDIEKVFFTGLGIRLAIMGQFTINALSGGPGGLKYELEHYKYLQQDVLNTLKNWTILPDSVRDKAVAQAEELTVLKGKSYDELVRWRDNKLISLLKHLNYLPV